MSRFASCAAVLAPVLLALVGCHGSPEDKRVNIAGNATFGGKPIVFGSIDFVPDGSKGHSGPAGSATIVDGKYDTAAGGGGIFPGPHTVRITGFDARPPERKSELDPAPEVQPLFTNYTVSLELKVSPVNLDVPESARGKDSSKSQEAKPAPRP